jgi:osmotically-inducible protein OsmY
MNIANKLFCLVIGASVLCAAPALQGCRTTESPGTQMSDSAITTKVKAKMIADKDVAAHNVDVNTEEGIVYLMGRVKTPQEKMEAEKIARETEGVRGVVNHLQVGDATEASYPKGTNDH